MKSLSEAYKEYPLHLNHIIPLDFSSLLTLPDSHAWPQPNNDYLPLNNNGSSSSPSIPIIDLMDPNAKDLIGHACEEWGAFQIKNHGIPSSVIQEVENEAKRLFSLPSQQKLKALRSPNGATGYGRARISPFFPKFMWHEGFTIIGSPSHDARKIWPHDYKSFCDLMENYGKQVKMVAERVTKMILEVLEMREEKREWVGSTNIGEAVQLNCYPSCPEPNRAMGLAPHTDTSLITILHQSQTTGLQIFREQIGWVPVHPHPNALVVNTGDLLHIMSNARFRCALHRVTVNRTRQRYSVAYFYSPPLDFVISPPPDRHVIARFRAVSVKEYIGIKAKNLGDALSLIGA